MLRPHSSVQRLRARRPDVDAELDARIVSLIGNENALARKTRKGAASMRCGWPKVGLLDVQRDVVKYERRLQGGILSAGELERHGLADVGAHVE
jgi:hypothetical protein